MAPTYTPQDGLEWVRKYVRDVPLADVDVRLADIVHSRLWRYRPWRWTQSALTGIALVDAQQDYTIANTDVFRLLRLRIVRTDSTPDEIYPDLDITDELSPSLTSCGYPVLRQACLEPVTGKLRLEYAAAVGASETAEIRGEYQRLPTTITDATLSTAFAFPDVYFNAYCEGLKWKLYDYVGDSRAGSMTTDRAGRRIYSGQLGVFMDELASMAEDEDYNGQQFLVPDIPMGAGA